MVETSECNNSQFDIPMIHPGLFMEIPFKWLQITSHSHCIISWKFHFVLHFTVHLKCFTPHESGSPAQTRISYNEKPNRWFRVTKTLGKLLVDMGWFFCPVIWGWFNKPYKIRIPNKQPLFNGKYISGRLIVFFLCGLSHGIHRWLQPSPTSQLPDHPERSWCLGRITKPMRGEHEMFVYLPTFNKTTKTQLSRTAQMNPDLS